MNDTTKHEFKVTINFLLKSIPKLNPAEHAETISFIGEAISRIGTAYQYITEADKPAEGL